MRCLLSCALVLLTASAALAADHMVEVLKEAPPADALSADVVSKLAPEGAKVMRGSRTVGTYWLAKEWPTKAGFKPSSTVLYPFEVGQLIGAIRFKSKSADFRGQEIPSGVYTIRYALQPEDGNHVGTSVTRDFFVLLSAEQDTSSKTLPQADLFKLSAAAAGTAHPAMLSLVAPAAGAESPSLRHAEELDWWILHLQGVGSADGKSMPLPVEFVVVGKAAE